MILTDLVSLFVVVVVTTVMYLSGIFFSSQHCEQQLADQAIAHSKHLTARIQSIEQDVRDDLHRALRDKDAQVEEYRICVEQLLPTLSSAHSELLANFNELKVQFESARIAKDAEIARLQSLLWDQSSQQVKADNMLDQVEALKNENKALRKLAEVRGACIASSRLCNHVMSLVFFDLAFSGSKQLPIRHWPQVTPRRPLPLMWTI
jgi:hypothetical protein